MEGGVLSIQPIIDGAIRVRFSTSLSKSVPSVILVGNSPAPAFTVEENSRGITVSTSTLRATVDRSSQALIFTDAFGKILLQEKPGGRLLKSGLPEGSDNMIAEQTFLSPSNEFLLGLVIPGWVSQRQGIAAKIDAGQYADFDSFPFVEQRLRPVMA